MDEIVSQSLLDSVDVTRYVDPDLFDLGPLTHYYVRDDEEEALFTEAAAHLPELVADSEMDAIFSQAAASVDQMMTEYSSAACSTIPECSSTVSAPVAIGKFGAPVDLDALKDSAVPRSTKKQTKWCASRWMEWAQSRNDVHENKREAAPVELIGVSDKELAYWVQRFVTEVRKKDGSVYPSETLYALVCGIQRYMRTEGKRAELDFFTNPIFSELKLTVDAEMKRIGGLGIGTKKRKAEVISSEQEELLWSKGLLGDKSPQTLLTTVVYNNGFYFALRSGKEHRNLRADPCQISLFEPPCGKAYLQYVEDESKNRPGGLKGRKKARKVIQHANLENPERCPVRVFKLYQSLCPKNRPANAFYLQPLKCPRKDCWYSTVPVGCNELSKIIGRLCKDGGLLGHYTNHSLRATACSRLYTLGVDEQLIMERSGHSSVAGVRSYKRTTHEQKEKVSDLMHSKKLKIDCEADKENTDMKSVVGEGDITRSHNALAPVQVPCPTPTPPQLTPGTTPLGVTFNMSSCTVNISYNY